MSDIQSRPARGRSTARGGRGGGHGSRGPRPSKQTNGDGAVDTWADQGELGELKKRYSSQLSTLKELFPDWADVDLVFALQDSDGDLASTIEKITEGERLRLLTIQPTLPVPLLTPLTRPCLAVRRGQEGQRPIPLKGQGHDRRN